MATSVREEMNPNLIVFFAIIILLACYITDANNKLSPKDCLENKLWDCLLKISGESNLKMDGSPSSYRAKRSIMNNGGSTRCPAGYVWFYVKCLSCYM